MNFRDLFNIIWHNMWKRKARTIFTMSGVIIGCLSIFIIISISNGFEKYLTDSLGGIANANEIRIWKNGMYFDSDSKVEGKPNKTETLNDDAINELSELDFVEKVLPIKTTYMEAKYKKSTRYINIQSTDFEKFDAKSDLIYGRLPNNSFEIVINYDTAKELLLSDEEIESLHQNGDYFKQLDNEHMLESLINKSIELFTTGYDEEGNPFQGKKMKLKIVGIMSYKPSVSAWFSYVQMDTIHKLIELDPMLSKKEIKERKANNDELIVYIKDESNLEANELEIKSLGYGTQTALTMLNEIEMMLTGVKLVLGFLAGISLVVAALGITNTMEMAIYERNKEIGIMKVIGARIKDIHKIFIGEACAISVFGGVISIVLGLLVNMGINGLIRMLAGDLGISKIAIADFGLIIGIIGFTFIIGLISGFMPAKKATKVNIIETLK